MTGVNQCERGRSAEKLVARYLLANGYSIWKTNWRWGRKELDLVATYHGELVIVEVKCTVDNQVNIPSEVVDKQKQRHIILATDAFIWLHNVQMPTRFDVIAVSYNSGQAEIQHIENAFFPGVE